MKYLNLLSVRRINGTDKIVWYMEINRCIMQGRDREKHGCTGKT